MSRVLRLAAVSLLLGACASSGEDSPAPDAGHPVATGSDAGADAGEQASTPDAGESTDAGSDAGTDAGEEAAPPDAGTTPDAGPPILPGVASRVGPGGGTLTLPGVATLTVPAGALTAEVELRVAEDPGAVTPPGLRALSPHLRFTPEGLTFAAPITVSFELPAPAPMDARVYWTSQAEPSGYEALASLAPESGTTLTANVTHFSGGFAGAPFDEARCGDEAGPVSALLRASTPIQSRRIQNRSGSRMGVGPGGQLYLTVVGYPSLYIAANGRDFVSVTKSAPHQAEPLIDAAHDWVYVTVDAPGNDGTLVRRRHAVGCFEDVAHFSGVKSLMLTGVDAQGNVVGVATMAGTPATWQVAYGAAGEKWRLRDQVFTSQLRSAHLAPGDPNRLYVLTQQTPQQLATSRDGGLTWTGPDVIVGLTSGVADGQLTIDPADPDVIFATARKLVRSTDGGRTFTEDPAQPPGDRYGLPAFGPDRTLYIDAYDLPPAPDQLSGLYARAPGASDWRRVDEGLPPEVRNGNVFALGPTPGEVWRMERSIWVTRDNGASWSGTGSGLPGLYPSPLATDPTSPDRMFLFTEDQPTKWFVTHDAGATVSPVEWTCADPKWGLAVLGDGTVIAPCHALVEGAAHYGFRSTDHGRSFKPMAGLPLNGSSGFYLSEVVLPERDPQRAWIVNAGALYLTTDSGATWAEQPVRIGGADARGKFFVDPSTAGRLVGDVTVGGTKRLVESLDAGRSWAEWSLPAGDEPFTPTHMDAQGTLWAVKGSSPVVALRSLAKAGASVGSQPPPGGVSGHLVLLGDTLIWTLRDLTDYRAPYRWQLAWATRDGVTWTPLDLSPPSPLGRGMFHVAHRADPRRVVFDYMGLRFAPLTLP